MPRLRAAAVALFALTGCASAQQPAEAPAKAAGSSAQAPVVLCGPAEAYRYVAREPVCPGKWNPFGGDVDAARRSRSGASQDARTGHYVDSYEVPCAEGPVTVYVDMYGCEEMEALQRQFDGPPSPRVERLVGAFDASDYASVMSRCAGVMLAGKPLDEWVWCGYLQPASMVMIGQTREAAEFVSQLCSTMPKAGPKSDARLDTVASVLVWTARASAGRGRELAEQEAAVVLQVLSQACEVAPRDVILRLQALTGETA